MLRSRASLGVSAFARSSAASLHQRCSSIAAVRAFATEAAAPPRVPKPASPAPADPTPAAPKPPPTPPPAPAITISKGHKVVVVGGGPAGLAISHQLLRSGKFAQDDIAIVDPAEWHHYQPGWTLVGGGLKEKEELRRPMKELVDPQFKFYNQAVGGFTPEQNFITLGNGDKIGYEQLVVAPGININYDSVKGLPEALADKDSLVSSIYGYDTVSKVFGTIERLRKGTAIFTQPAGVIKCAGAPRRSCGSLSTTGSRLALTIRPSLLLPISTLASPLASLSCLVCQSTVPSSRSSARSEALRVSSSTTSLPLSMATRLSFPAPTGR
uniref:FAD/NAD(P)-binding domain-containing protein n=1 Tax=Bionectria ochroleuca TaxID=29856 RepID=A0A8H7K8R2_BIOOC